jgi:hypothetical protein
MWAAEVERFVNHLEVERRAAASVVFLYDPVLGEG